MFKYIVPLAGGLGIMGLSYSYACHRANKKTKKTKKKQNPQNPQTPHNKKSLEFLESPKSETLCFKEYQGHYKQFMWKITRPTETNWCAYIALSDNDYSQLSQNQLDKLSNIADADLMCGIGFNCEYPEHREYGVDDTQKNYKHHKHVFQKIKEIIDYLEEQGLKGSIKRSHDSIC